MEGQVKIKIDNFKHKYKIAIPSLTIYIKPFPIIKKLHHPLDKVGVFFIQSLLK